jgi:hypothetical protein
VSVGNAVGMSNADNFTFSATGVPPLAFAQKTVELAPQTAADSAPRPSLLTQIVYGPDHRWYASSLDGHVYSFLLTRDLKMSNVCQSQSLGSQRSVLSIAFNPNDLTPRVYAASSILYWRAQGKINDAAGWQNGMVHILEPSGSSDSGNGLCMKHIGAIITGLPVSNHDHGVNKLLFTQDADLLIQVGSFTNAGDNTFNNSLGGMDESPLSAACLIAAIFQTGFDGAVKYDSTNAGEAHKVSGDVSIYATGFRNSFGAFIIFAVCFARFLLRHRILTLHGDVTNSPVYVC